MKILCDQLQDLSWAAWPEGGGEHEYAITLPLAVYRVMEVAGLVVLPEGATPAQYAPVLFERLVDQRQVERVYGARSREVRIPEPSIATMREIRGNPTPDRSWAVRQRVFTDSCREALDKARMAKLRKMDGAKDLC